MRRSRHAEPIIAVASGQGASAIALLRISGENCVSQFSTHFRFKEKKTLQSISPRKVYRCDVFDPESQKILDDAMVVVFQGPHSYTGQDTIEIYCHGGIFITQNILRMFYTAGARPADPGEFTHRAYLNNKLDLTQAEGIRELIDAQSEDQWQAARNLAQGGLRNEIERLRQSLLQILALVEARIDFPDEGDVASARSEKLDAPLKELRRQIGELMSTFRNGDIVTHGLKVVLCGPPNAGKSTLLNVLLGRERALVTAVPGTTRDFIEERCLVGGKTVRLIDTAGLRETRDPVENLGIAKAQELISKADIVLFLAGSDLAANEVNYAYSLLKQTPVNRLILIMTKADLSLTPVILREERWVKISCQDMRGLDDLRLTIKTIADESTAALEKSPFITSARHESALRNAGKFLDRAIALVNQSVGFSEEELLSFELQAAHSALTSITGDISNEEVLDEVFGKFCVGK